MLVYPAAILAIVPFKKTKQQQQQQNNQNVRVLSPSVGHNEELLQLLVIVDWITGACFTQSRKPYVLLTNGRVYINNNIHWLLFTLGFL